MILSIGGLGISGTIGSAGLIGFYSLGDKISLTFSWENLKILANVFCFFTGISYWTGSFSTGISFSTGGVLQTCSTAFLSLIILTIVIAGGF